MTNPALGSLGDSFATSRSTLGGIPFPPIEEYGFLSDCEVCALVAPNGNVEWMCLPRMDGPSIFAAVLDRIGGLLLATDTTFLLTTCFDWGPVVLQHFLNDIFLIFSGKLIIVKSKKN